MSTTLRISALRALRTVGMRSFVAKSAFGHRFVCHLGDSLGENPFYNMNAFRAELALSAAWMSGSKNEVIFDVGANVGFWSTQLVQMIAGRSPIVFAFEPVPLTFAKLAESVERLGLSDRIQVVSGAVMDGGGVERLAYASYDSMLATAGDRDSAADAATKVVYAPRLTLDDFASAVGVQPSLLKIDIEGSELAALRGARRMLSRQDRPAVIFEYNPEALSRAGEDRSSVSALLSGYALHYVDDFEGQRRPFGTSITALSELDWVCNVFAVPDHVDGLERWRASLAIARQRLTGAVSRQVSG